MSSVATTLSVDSLDKVLAGVEQLLKANNETMTQILNAKIEDGIANLRKEMMEMIEPLQRRDDELMEKIEEKISDNKIYGAFALVNEVEEKEQAKTKLRDKLKAEYEKLDGKVKEHEAKKPGPRKRPRVTTLRVLVANVTRWSASWQGLLQADADVWCLQEARIAENIGKCPQADLGRAQSRPRATGTSSSSCSIILGTENN